ncbi:MAG: histidine phosphatase family protein [Litorivicinaceae bacterium]|jgi:phosphohistidine phosphatase|nr:histidine phosphatase family protein [Litorivicinaceae bacterium]
MQLILMRHGEAIPFARTDADRTLTPRGEAEAIEIGHQLRQARVSVVRGHSSGYRRAFQTCQLMCTEIGAEVGAEIPHLTPDSALDAAVKALERAVSDGDLVVFHQPLLTKVVGYLVYADPTHDVEPRAMTGTAYVLSLSDFSRGGARLIASYQPVIS